MAIQIPGRDVIELIGDTALFEFLTPPSQEKAKDSLSSGLLFLLLFFNHYIGFSESFFFFFKAVLSSTD